MNICPGGRSPLSAQIAVLLPDVDRPDLPTFLDGMTSVDLAVADPDPFDQMEWGITGRHPDR
jgi:hypothetical protein